MVEDLKKQASEAYRAESEKGELLTSESLSMKRLLYIFVAVAAVLLVAIQIYGGFRPRQNSTLAALSAPPLVKETPPPELMNPEPAQNPPAAMETPPPARAADIAAPERAQPAPEPARSEPPRPKAPVARAPSPPASGKPILKRDAAAARSEPADRPGEPKTDTPSPPQVSPEEQARREQAREIVIRSSPAMAQLLTTTKSQAWEAQPQRENVYLVSFTVPGDTEGAQVQYVWKVELASSSASPLNYYAKKLP
ncbi:MAG: hypothetical protein FJW35_10580 [Acidobacteria bacterium]|nr:hypothetical protein [Acidobacteriota bacterium]